MTKEKVEQVYYGDWGADLKPEHKGYWADVGLIARLIASQLEGYRTAWQRDGGYSTSKSSSIVVSQYKEKFGEIRVYCTLADRDYLQKVYDSADFLQKDFPDFEAYVEAAYITDVKHYRAVHLEMVRLFPHYQTVILGGADYPQFLCETEEEFKEICKRAKHWDEQSDFVTEICWPKKKETVK